MKTPKIPDEETLRKMVKLEVKAAKITVQMVKYTFFVAAIIFFIMAPVSYFKFNDKAGLYICIFSFFLNTFFFFKVRQKIKENPIT